MYMYCILCAQLYIIYIPTGELIYYRHSQFRQRSAATSKLHAFEVFNGGREVLPVQVAQPASGYVYNMQAPLYVWAAQRLESRLGVMMM